MSDRLRIRFQDKEWLLIGNLKEGGAIATKQSYENGTVSYAHLLPNGNIMRYSELIGFVEDIKVLGPVPDNELEMAEDAWDNLLSGETWGPK